MDRHPPGTDTPLGADTPPGADTPLQGLFVPFACVGSGDPVRVLRLLHNTLDTIEAFIAETYVQLVATEPMCYSTS